MTSLVAYVSTPYLIQPILYGDGCFTIFRPHFSTISLDMIFSPIAILNDDITQPLVYRASSAKDVVSLLVLFLSRRQK